MKRIDAIDVLKAFAILLVVYGHVIQFGLTSDRLDEPVYRFIYTFHMPLFMVLCGFFSQSSMNLSWLALVRKKFNSLIIPCISWGMVIYVLLVGVHLLKNKPGGGILELLSLIWTNYWFLKALFACYVLAWFCFNTSIISKFCSVPAMCLISQLIEIFNLPIMFPCFMIGMVVKQVIDSKWFVQLIPIYPIIYVVLLYFYNREYYDDTIERTVFISTYSASSILELLTIRFYRLILGISAALFFIAVIRKYIWTIQMGASKIMGYVLLCGRYSLGIYLIHTLFVSYLMQNLIHFDNVDSLLFYLLILPILSLVITMTCIIIIIITNKNRNLSLLLFGTNYINRDKC